MSTKILKQVREAVEQLNPNEVRQTAERRMAIRIAARDGLGYAAIEDFLVPGDISNAKRVQLAKILYRAGDPGVPERSDLDICQLGVDCPRDAFVFDPNHPDEFIYEVLENKQDLGLPLARCFEPFRKPVTDKIIASVAKENALFSVMTAMPDIAPGLALPWAVPEAVSDTTVLTINQVRMAFLLAAASDRPIGYREQKAEIGSLIAGAFGWRSLARQLTSKIPFGGGIIPKAGIAYAATFVVGLSLERFYRVGYGLTRAERRAAYGDALSRGREVAAAIVEGWRRGKNGNRRAAAGA